MNMPKEPLYQAARRRRRKKNCPYGACHIRKWLSKVLLSSKARMLNMRHGYTHVINHARIRAKTIRETRKWLPFRKILTLGFFSFTVDKFPIDIDLYERVSLVYPWRATVDLLAKRLSMFTGSLEIAVPSETKLPSFPFCLTHGDITGSWKENSVVVCCSIANGTWLSTPSCLPNLRLR